MVPLRSQNDAGIADALVAVQQVDLLGRYLPHAIALAETVPCPPGEDTRVSIPEFTDGEVRPDHALILALAPEDLDVGNHARCPRRRRLRPGAPRTQAEDAVFQPAAVVKHDCNLAPRIAALRRGGHPVRAFGCVKAKPLVVKLPVEESRFRLDESPEKIPLAGI